MKIHIDPLLRFEVKEGPNKETHFHIDNVIVKI